MRKGAMVMTEEEKCDGEEGVLCDWCGEEEAVGVFFVPGRGVVGLCARCRVFLVAVLVDIA
jgi:CRISPR/Cas system-associated protein Cas10 (large subunit of type III CRISPR-Cas system)